ncbi:MAG: hypothetical protein HY928_15355 [Elusimicrobia bacterium]|nr:hypothetical protein [Elusimicrobiota bacterium]
MRYPKGADKRRGAILVVVILLLAIMSVLVPLMVVFTQREAKWTVKGDQNMTAFHLAEAGIEKGFRVLTASTNTWYNLVEDGTGITDFKWDHRFEDVVAGYYAVGISSGPEAYQATVVSIGREAGSNEVRAIKAIFAQNHTDTAIQSMAGITVGGGVDVEWGAVVGNAYTNSGGRTSPQFHSSAGLDVDNNAAPENCDQPDCCQWHAFSQDIPPDPKIDLGFYRSSAAASTCDTPPAPNLPASPVGSCYFNTVQAWSSFDYSEGGTVMVENNLTIGSPGVDIKGNLIVTGNMSSNTGGFGKGSVTMKVPENAWKQYCNNWAHYLSEFSSDAAWDAAHPAFPGLNFGYTSPSNMTYGPTPNGKFAVQGFVYIGGTFSTGGGAGNTYIYGNMFCKGSVNIDASSGVTVFYNKESAQSMRSLRVVLTRVHWQDMIREWPSGL